MYEEYQERFWAKVQKGQPDECWPWIASICNGYGQFYPTAKKVFSHRFSLEMKLGRRLTEQEYACHSCDNPPCCNPAHLFAGTAGDNARDCQAKGRGNTEAKVHHGEQHGSHKLTDQDVLFIRSTEMSPSAVAERLGTHVSNVRLIRARKTWRHI